MSESLDYWNLREARRIAYRVIHAKTAAEARARCRDLLALFEIPEPAPDTRYSGTAREAPGRRDGTAPPAVHTPAPAASPPTPRAGGTGPGTVAPGLPSRAVEPSRPPSPPADPKPKISAGEDALIRELRDLGATVDHGDKPGIFIIDGLRLGVFSAEDYRHKLRRRQAREART